MQWVRGGALMGVESLFSVRIRLDGFKYGYSKSPYQDEGDHVSGDSVCLFRNNC